LKAQRDVLSRRPQGVAALVVHQSASIGRGAVDGCLFRDVMGFQVAVAMIRRTRHGDQADRYVTRPTWRKRAMTEPKEILIVTAPSSATAPPTSKNNVLVSGSYGGAYNAYHAAKWDLRGVVLNDAGGGKNDAGIDGLPYLDKVGLAAATADALTCEIGDGDDMLANGLISHVNRAASVLGCRAGQTVQECATLMRAGPIVHSDLAMVSGGKRTLISDLPGEPKVVCLDAAPMLAPEDAGAIVITGSHAALFRGRPDSVVSVDVRAIIFSDAGVGKNQAGIRRLLTLDERAIVAGAADAASAPIGNARAIYEDGVLSHVNASAARLGGRPGMTVRALVDLLLQAFRAQKQ
jgi:hypothetical protein